MTDNLLLLEIFPFCGRTPHNRFPASRDNFSVSFGDRFELADFPVPTMGVELSTTCDDTPSL